MMTEEQLRLLAAAADRILPSDGRPGAATAQVRGYLEGAHATDRGERLRRGLEGGLALLQDVAQDLYGRSFPDCSESERDEVLRRVQAVPHPATSRFFRLLIKTTIAAFLCDPLHGGNRDAAGWKLLGIHFERRPAGLARAEGS